TFPLERVVQIHIAGLACHPNIPILKENQWKPPLWIDAHEASVPEELFELLVRVVQESRLMNLKGIALEVDTKPISLICREMRALIERVGSAVTPPPQEWEPAVECPSTHEILERDCSKFGNLLNEQYHYYVEFIRSTVLHRVKVEREYNEEVMAESDYYFAQFLPYEI